MTTRDSVLCMSALYPSLRFLLPLHMSEEVSWKMEENWVKSLAVSKFS